MTTLDRIDGIAAGIAYKAPVKAVTSAPVTLSGLQTIGGVVLAAGDRVLVKDQADATANGIYDAATTAWSRSLDFDGVRDVVSGTIVSLDEDSETLRQFRLSATDPVEFGTTEITFNEISVTGGVAPSRTITAGTGLTGGGDLSTDRTIALDAGTIASLALADSAVQSEDVDGRSIFENADPVAGTQFLPGGTFTVDPANPRHRYIKVHDTVTALTANMTLSLAPAAAGWRTGDAVTIIKGDTSDFTITVTGFDADGLGNATLRQSRQGIICVYQSTDSDNGPGADGQKFERGPQFYGVLADVATSGDYTDLANQPVLGTASAQAVAYFLQPSQVAAGAITAATGALDLTGTNGQVLTLDGSGNIAPATPAVTTTFGSASVTDVAAGTNVTFADDGDGTITINVSSGTATLGDGDYGDVTVTASGTVITIDSGVVTNAKLATMAEATIKGRAAAAGTGAPVDLTATQARTILNVADGANAYVHPNHSGDVTSTADGATVIANNAVTTAKILDDAVTTGKIDDGAVTVAKLADYDAYQVVVRAAGTTGAPAAVAASANHVLRRSGSGNLGFGTLVNANIGDGEIDVLKLDAGVQASLALADAALPILDEDDFATDSATKPPSQQSVKAYVDAGDHAALTLASALSATISTSRDLLSSDTVSGLSGQVLTLGRFRFIDASGGALVLPLAASLTVGDALELFVTDATNSITIARPTVSEEGTGTTNGTDTVTMADTSMVRVGDTVSGTSVTSSQTVLSITEDTSIVLSAVADGSTTDDTLTFTGKRGTFNGSEADVTLRKGFVVIKVIGDTVGIDAEIVGATTEGFGPINIATEVADFTLAATHLGKRVRLTKATGTHTVTIPKPSVLNADPGQRVEFKATLAGATTFTLAGTGSPVFVDVAADSLNIVPGGVAVLTAVDADTWDIEGNMVAA